mmetsp:Transcript_15601/g.27710  ORF Transcript_15601/g.27710 Transcript_15601/m.27710 type:complete len:236 (-) Transcript_15601:258-965(-)|eukprot:CAMPEP_0184549078 /NCGR_PEP_ID=MMETSP0199_2-20130426/6586_1 /TAXON_ID=1112570 /ORGANISM="Thraustochytrium sp., Strain LLF1b" /LENGTH=235 /DNA_ID=CAMNT_0026943763 /DNA_START=116 /DNA_END=823 /DNA_ORIENTATION=+
MSNSASRTNRALWHIFDGRNAVVGRLAVRCSTLVIGKHKPTYSPNLDHGDNVVVVNAKDLILTGKKMEKKLYRWHTGHMGGLKQMTPKFLSEVKNRPGEILTRAVSGMLPKNRLRKKRLARLHVFDDEDHPFWPNFSDEAKEEFLNRELYIPPPKRSERRKPVPTRMIPITAGEEQWEAYREAHGIVPGPVIDDPELEKMLERFEGQEGMFDLTEEEAAKVYEERIFEPRRRRFF